jgi:hypothetical protein
MWIALVGCQRHAAPPPAAVDYRKLNQTELVALIKEKLRVESLELAPDGPDRYKGSMPSPDGTIRLPIEVAVEAERIVITTRAAGMTSRQIITPRGLESDLR